MKHSILIDKYCHELSCHLTKKNEKVITIELEDCQLLCYTFDSDDDIQDLIDMLTKLKVIKNE